MKLMLGLMKKTTLKKIGQGAGIIFHNLDFNNLCDPDMLLRINYYTSLIKAIIIVLLSALL